MRNSFDVVFLDDVMEHVYNPEGTLREALRVVKAGGHISINFVPYYSPLGGHLYNFISRWWLHLFLPRSVVKKILLRKAPIGFRTPSMEWDDYNSLNRITVRRFERMLRHSASMINILHYQITNRVARLPIVKELIAGSVICILEKKK